MITMTMIHDDDNDDEVGRYNLNSIRSNLSEIRYGLTFVCVQTVEDVSSSE